jgi:predicted Zn-ribbon and HTH transcriptional regulator
MIRMTVCSDCGFSDVRTEETDCPLCDSGVME